MPDLRLHLVACTLLAAAGCARQTVLPALPSTGMEKTLRQQVDNAAYAGAGDLRGRELRARLAAAPGDVEARGRLAAHYEELGFFDVALEHYRLGLERQPDSVPLLLGQVRALRRLHLNAQAAAALEAFTSAHHDAPASVHSWLGIVRDDLGDPFKAAAAHARAAALEPASDRYQNNLGYNLLLQGKYAEAAAALRSALRINPQSGAARGNLALALALDRRAPDARQALAEWQAVGGPAAAHNNLAAAWIEQGRYAEARQELASALSFKRDFQPALENLNLIGGLGDRELPGAGGPRRSVWYRFGNTLKKAVLGADLKPAAGTTGN